MATAISDQRRRKEAMEDLVLELSRGDEDNIIHALRTAIDRGWLQSFSDILKESKKKKDTEIDRICSRHYIDFLTSVKELLHMRGSAVELKQLVSAVHGKFHLTGGDLVQTLHDLQMIQSEREQSRHLLESTLLCKEVSKMMQQVNADIVREAHYKAMRTIELIQLEVTRCKDIHNNAAAATSALASAGILSTRSHVVLPQSMLTLVEKWLPVAVNKLLYSVRGESDLLLSTVRSHMAMIGQSMLFRQVSIITGTTQDTKASTVNHLLNANPVPYHSNASHSVNASAPSPSPLQAIQQCEQFVAAILPAKLTLSLKHLLPQISLFQVRTPSTYNRGNSVCLLPLSDFSPFLSPHYSLSPSPPEVSAGSDILDHRMTDIAALNKTLHLYAVLGKLGNYHDYYRNLRLSTLQGVWRQLDLDMDNLGLLSGCCRFFENMLGFFTIEAMISRLVEVPHVTFARETLQQLYIETMSYFSEQLMARVVTLSSEIEVLLLKEELVLVVTMLSDEMYYGLTTEPVLLLLTRLWDVFDGLLMQSLVVVMQDAMSYQPYTVTSTEELQKQVRIYALDSLDIEMANNTPNSPSTGNAGNNSQNPGSGGLPLGHSSSSSSSHAQPLLDSKALDRNLDALEEEINTSPSNLSLNQRGSLNNDAPLGATGGGNSHNSKAMFVSQTFAFSSFVPTLLQDLHSRIIKIFLYSILKLPNSRSPQERPTNSAVLSSSPSPKQEAAVHEGYTANWVGLVLHSIVKMYETTSSLLLSELKRGGVETSLSKVCQLYIDATFLSLSVDMFTSMVEGILLHFSAFDFHSYQVADSRQRPHNARARPGKAGSAAQDTPSQLQDKVHAQMQFAAAQISRSLAKVTSTAQDLLFECLAYKLTGLLESLVFINFAPDSVPPGVNPHGLQLHHNTAPWVHEEVSSVLDFLGVTFMLLTHLPRFLREAVYFTSCKQLANGLLLHVLSPAVNSVNVFGLLGLEADCKKLVQFADSCGVESLRQCFVELQELVGCVLSTDLAGLVENVSARKKLFPHVDVQKLVVLLDKVAPSPLLAQSGNLPRFEKAPTKILVKKLRTLANQY